MNGDVVAFVAVSLAIASLCETAEIAKLKKKNIYIL